MFQKLLLAFVIFESVKIAEWLVVFINQSINIKTRIFHIFALNFIIFSELFCKETLFIQTLDLGCREIH